MTTSRIILQLSGSMNYLMNMKRTYGTFETEIVVHRSVLDFILQDIEGNWEEPCDWPTWQLFTVIFS